MIFGGAIAKLRYYILFLLSTTSAISFLFFFFSLRLFVVNNARQQ